jgi:hypothetical protein
VVSRILPVVVRSCSIRCAWGRLLQRKPGRDTRAQYARRQVVEDCVRRVYPIGWCSQVVTGGDPLDGQRRGVLRMAQAGQPGGVQDTTAAAAVSVQDEGSEVAQHIEADVEGGTAARVEDEIGAVPAGRVPDRGDQAGS